MTKLLCVGDLNLDIAITIEGELALGSDGPGTISLHGGGSAANVAAWATHQGADTRFVGVVGDDPTGDFLRSELSDNGVDLQLIRRAGSASRSIAVIVGSDGNRSLVSNQHTVVAPSIDDYQPDWFDHVSWLHLTGYTYVTPHSRPLFAHLTAQARDRGIPYSIDPSAARMLSHMCTRTEVLASFNGARVLFPSHDEAEYLTTNPNPRDAAIELLELAHTVAVTCGPNGVHLADRDHGSHHIAAETIEVNNTLGCGDAFAGAYLAAILRGHDPLAAVGHGIRTATRATQVAGGR